MDTILLSQDCGKVLLKDKVLKPNINLDAIVSVLMSYGIHDETKYILDLALSETKVKPRNIGDVVKFHYKNYSDRGNPSLSQLKEYGLEKDGYIFGRISDKNRNEMGRINRPYHRVMYVDFLTITNFDNDVESREIKFKNDPVLIDNLELKPTTLKHIPYYGANKS
jgi:hypothetical protein